MSIIRLFDEHGLQYATEGHKHCRPGWANMPCPFCTGNPGMHLGVEISTGRFVCWRCGGKSGPVAISKLLHVTQDQAKALLRKYRGRARTTTNQNHKIKFKPHRFPSNTTSMTERHMRYLEKRGFEPGKLIDEWALMGTGPISKLDGIDYKFRIVAPILWDHKQVSFQARDITGKSELKYKACPMHRETIHHKHILYGRQEYWTETGICVEGITDAWRFGPQSFGTLGIKYTMQQVLIMVKTFKRVFVVFDDDPQAVRQSKKLCAQLRGAGVDAVHIDIKGDPGGMSQDDADHFVNQLLRRR